MPMSQQQHKSAMDIALTLQISVNTVRSYIRRHPLEDSPIL